MGEIIISATANFECIYLNRLKTKLCNHLAVMVSRIQYVKEYTTSTSGIGYQECNQKLDLPPKSKQLEVGRNQTKTLHTLG